MQKTFTKAELKELLASKANDNVFLMNDNGIYMSRGKVVNGESVGVGRVSETFSAKLTGRQREIKTSLFLRKGENPSKRPTWRQSEIDDTIRYRKAGYTVEPQVSFLNGKRCKNGISDSIRVDNYVEGLAAVEIKNYNLTTNSSGLVSNIVEQAIKHQQHLPKGTRQIFKIDARGQAASLELQRSINQRIISRSQGILSSDDVVFIE